MKHYDNIKQLKKLTPHIDSQSPHSPESEKSDRISPAAPVPLSGMICSLRIAKKGLSLLQN